MIKLATAYEQGLGVDRDDSKALFYYQTSAEQGHPEAQHKLGKKQMCIYRITSRHG